MRRKILLINAVPTNNGDAALVFALYEALKSEGYDVTIATQQFEAVVEIYKDICFIKDIASYRYIHRIKIISLISTIFLFIIKSKYRTSDCIIGVPGGYVNSYYRLYHRLILYRIAKLFGKKTIIYSQSLGPFKQNQMTWIRKYLNYVDMIFVRDNLSYEVAKKNLLGKNVVLSNDAAFLLSQKVVDYNQKDSSRIVAISVRSWKHDFRDLGKYYKLITALVSRLVEKDYKVIFLSTCQGIKGYVDDSITAQEIYKILPDNIKQHVKVDSRFYKLDQLRKELMKFDFVIGTRLHMCILSMLNGTPAFNITYEFKSKELYKSLGLEEIAIDYNSSLSDALKFLNLFVDNLNDFKKKTQSAVEKERAFSIITYNHLIRLIDEK